MSAPQPFLRILRAIKSHGHTFLKGTEPKTKPQTKHCKIKSVSPIRCHWSRENIPLIGVDFPIYLICIELWCRNFLEQKDIKELFDPFKPRC